MKKKLILFLIALIFIPSIPGFVSAQGIEAPKDLEGVQQFGKDFWERIKNQLPDLMKKAWQEDILPIWRKMKEVWSRWWDSHIQPWLEKIWDKFMVLLGQEVEKRKPYIEEEFQKEKEELIEEVDKKVPEQGRSIWEKLKELIQ